MRFVKKPKVIDAVKFLGNNIQDIWDVFGTEGIEKPEDENANYVLIDDAYLGLGIPVIPGRWILRGSLTNTFYSLSDEVMDALYNPTEDKIS